MKTIADKIKLNIWRNISIPNKISTKIILDFSINIFLTSDVFLSLVYEVYIHKFKKMPTLLSEHNLTYYSYGKNC